MEREAAGGSHGAVMTEHFSHPEGLVADVAALWRDALLSDTTLRAPGPDGSVASFQVHAAVLAARSEYFRAMFGHEEFVEAETRSVELPDVSPSELEALLGYVYTAEGRVDAGSTWGLLVAADKVGGRGKVASGG